MRSPLLDAACLTLAGLVLTTSCCLWIRRFVDDLLALAAAIRAARAEKTMSLAEPFASVTSPYHERLECYTQLREVAPGEYASTPVRCLQAADQVLRACDALGFPPDEIASVTFGEDSTEGLTFEWGEVPVRSGEITVRGDGEILIGRWDRSEGFLVRVVHLELALKRLQRWLADPAAKATVGG